MGENDLEQLIFEQPKCCNKCQGELEYIGIGRYRCVNCQNEMLDEYGKLKEYFREHGSASIAKTMMDTGISREKIDIFMNRGTAEFIGTGHASVKNDITSAIAEKVSSGKGMYFLGKNKK